MARNVAMLCVFDTSALVETVEFRYVTFCFSVSPNLVEVVIKASTKP